MYLTNEERVISVKNLRTLIREYSERTWCAGWLIDIEHIIWDKINEPEFAAMKALSQHIGGWVDYDLFVPEKEWLDRHKSWKERTDEKNV